MSSRPKLKTAPAHVLPVTGQSKIFYVQVRRLLGGGHPNTTLAASALMTLLIFFYTFNIGSYLNIEVFILKNRITYASGFHYYLIGDRADKIIICIAAASGLFIIFRKKIELVGAALAYTVAASVAIVVNIPDLLSALALLSFPFIGFLLLYGRFVVKKDKTLFPLEGNLIRNYVAVALIFLGFESLILSIAPVFSFYTGSIDSRNYAFLIFALLSSSSPILLSLLVFCLPTKILIDELIHFTTSIKKRMIGSLSQIEIDSSTMSSRFIFVFLSLTVLLSVGLAAIPHLPSINKDNQQIGADADVYVGWQRQLMKSKGTLQFLNTAFAKIGGGDRPISILFFYGLSNISGRDLLYITDRLPMILAPLLVLAIYFLTRELTSNDFISLFAAFFTTVSFQTMVGFYTGYYSNWFALIIGYFSMTFLLRYLKNQGRTNLLFFALLIIATLFSHAYTWSILALVMGIFLGVVAKLKYYGRKTVAVLFMVIIMSAAIDFVRVQVTGSNGALEKDSLVALSQGAGLGQFSEKWKNLTETVWTFYGGLMSNFIILSLGLYWLARARKKDVHSIMIITFLSIGILPLFFSGWVIQTRVLYDIPFQIPAAIGMYAIRRQRSGPLYITAICVWLIAMSVRAVTNLTL